MKKLQGHRSNEDLQQLTMYKPTSIILHSLILASIADGVHWRTMRVAAMGFKGRKRIGGKQVVTKDQLSVKIL